MAEPSVKQWKRVSWEKGRIKFAGKVLEHSWVKFNRDWEDGHAIYRKDQVTELPDREKLAFYLEEGHVTPCDPPESKKDRYATAPLAVYQFLDSIVIGNKGYAPGHEYVMPQPRGDKYVDRGLAVKVRDYKVKHGDEPENTMRRGGSR